jgi:hypothetical protein
MAIAIILMVAVTLVAAKAVGILSMDPRRKRRHFSKRNDYGTDR